MSSWKRYLFLGLAGAVIALAAVVFLVGNRQSPPLDPNKICDRIVLLKSQRHLILYKDDKELKTYRVALGGNPVGEKHQEGDQKTPEGLYRITHKHTSNSFYRSMHVSYPEAKDRAYAKKYGIKQVGGLIKIHGLPKSLSKIGSLHTVTDWTAGCIAVTNQEIDELFRAVPDNTPLEIRP